MSKSATETYLNIPGWLYKSKVINWNQKAILWQLTALSHKKGYAYMGQKALSNELGILIRRLRRDLKELENLGMISIAYGHGRGNYYTVLPVQELVPKLGTKTGTNLVPKRVPSLVPNVVNQGDHMLALGITTERMATEELTTQESLSAKASLCSAESPIPGISSHKSAEISEKQRFGKTGVLEEDLILEKDGLSPKPAQDYGNALALAYVHKVWDEEYSKAYPGVPLAKTWQGKLNGQAAILLGKYGEGEVATAFRYIIRNWDVLKPRFTKSAGVYPTVSFITGLADILVPEAPRMFQAMEDIRAMRDWNAEHLDTTYSPPKELQQKYDAALSLLKAG